MFPYLDCYTVFFFCTTVGNVPWVGLLNYTPRFRAIFLHSGVGIISLLFKVQTHRHTICRQLSACFIVAMRYFLSLMAFTIRGLVICKTGIIPSRRVEFLSPDLLSLSPLSIVAKLQKSETQRKFIEFMWLNQTKHVAGALLSTPYLEV